MYILLDDWKSDHYRWFNQGVTALPRKAPKLEKCYYSIDTPTEVKSDFQRHVYKLKLINDTWNFTLVLVHYLGDNNKAVDFPHRNAKNHLHYYFCSLPSYIKSCEEKVAIDKASIVCKREVAGMKNSAASLDIPRNIQQLRNLRLKVLNEKHIFHDSLYNLHEIAYDVPGYIWKLSTHPDLVCVCALKEILEEMDRVLLLKDDCGQILSYNTTFQLGDFYVRIYIDFCHLLFKEKPSIPAAFLFHERKFTQTHEELFHVMCEQVPSLKKLSTIPLVMDGEKAITTAIKHRLPNVKLVRCWNHIFRDIKYWLQQHGGKPSDSSICCDDVCCLFQATSEGSYNKLLKKFQIKWDRIFEKYYMKSFHNNISSISRWSLEELSIYNPYSGITNNYSESLNRYVSNQI